MTLKIITIHQALINGQKLLKFHNIENHKLDARILLQEILSVSYEELLSKFDDDINKELYYKYHNLLDRRIKREPISQIIGNKEFFGYNFAVNRNTLTPRPDSETLIEACLELFPDNKLSLNIIDLGTGTGCLLLTLLSEFPNAIGLGIDISEDALQIAIKNAKNLSLDKRSKFIINDWTNNISEKFDIIITNPPYIRLDEAEKLETEVILYEPHTALFGGEDGLECYRIIASQVPNILNKDGYVVVECGYEQYEQIAEIFRQNNLNIYMCKKDLSGIKRCIVINFK